MRIKYWTGALLLCAIPFLAQAKDSTSVQPITSVVMEQFACFWGTCPHYLIALNRDGSASYVGLEVAKTRGAVAITLPADAFSRITREIERIKYFKLKKQYASKDDGCKEMMSDQSAVAFYFTRGQETTVVSLYYGCKIPEITANLAGLADLIDQATGIEPLLGRKQQ